MKKKLFLETLKITLITLIIFIVIFALFGFKGYGNAFKSVAITTGLLIIVGIIIFIRFGDQTFLEIRLISTLVAITSLIITALGIDLIFSLSSIFVGRTMIDAMLILFFIIIGSVWGTKVIRSEKVLPNFFVGFLVISEAVIIISLIFFISI